MGLHDLVLPGVITLMAIMASPAVLMVLKGMEKSDKVIARLERHSEPGGGNRRKLKDLSLIHI